MNEPSHSSLTAVSEAREAPAETTVSEAREAPAETAVSEAREAPADLPSDIYIPPNALRVFLESFEGPLDLLLYLIRNQNLDILSLPIAEITKQYIQYIELMQELEIELAAEYLLMVATLAEIKSRLLLPRREQEEGNDETDPRSELVNRLIEYERIKHAAENLEAMPRCGREYYEFEIPCEKVHIVKPVPRIQLADLVSSYQSLLARATLHQQHRITKEPLLVSERINQVLKLLDAKRSVAFKDCFSPQEGEAGVVVALLALLELLKADMITVMQRSLWSAIYLQLR